MKQDDPIIDRSPEQKRARIEIMRLELSQYGYSIVKTAWLDQALKRFPREERWNARAEAMRP